MKRALVSYATGSHVELLELAVPRFAAYADSHGYDLLVPPSLPILDRPPSWGKLLVLRDAFDQGYDEALWLDADVVIVDGSRDLADEVDGDALQALVRHHTADGEVPNCGVWYLRAATSALLEALWERGDRYINHPWWEQAALLELLGYSEERPVRILEPTELYARTCWLGLEWNSHEENDRHPHPRFAHATAGSIEWRAAVMRSYLDARAIAH